MFYVISHIILTSDCPMILSFANLNNFYYYERFTFVHILNVFSCALRLFEIFMNFHLYSVYNLQELLITKYFEVRI